MATKIKLMRLGKMRDPHYRIVVADARTKRDGRSIETIGEYHPKNDPSVIKVDAERAAHWLSVGAQPTDAVTAIFKVTGDWQKFKGEPAPEPMRVAPPKADKRALFDAALADAGGEAPVADATTPKKKAAPKADAPQSAAPESATPEAAAAPQAAPAAPEAAPAAPEAAPAAPEAAPAAPEAAPAAPEASQAVAGESEAAPNAVEPAAESATSAS